MHNSFCVGSRQLCLLSAKTTFSGIVAVTDCQQFIALYCRGAVLCSMPEKRHSAEPQLCFRLHVHCMQELDFQPSQWNELYRAPALWGSSIHIRRATSGHQIFLQVYSFLIPEHRTAMQSTGSPCRLHNSIPPLCHRPPTTLFRWQWQQRVRRDRVLGVRTKGL